MPITDLEIQIADKLALAGPADLVFFAGRGFFPSRLIALGTTTPPQWWRGEWISHVGILFQGDDELLLGESTTLNDEPCVITGQHVKGVQAHHLVSRIAQYDGKVWLARLSDDWRDEFSFADDHKLTDFCLRYMGRPYDADHVILAGGCVLKHFLPASTKQVFCSEWNAEALKHLHMLSPETPSIAYNPAGLARTVVKSGTHRALERVK